MGGSADLAPSTKTYMSDMGDFSKDNYVGRNMHFGVRDMFSILSRISETLLLI